MARAREAAGVPLSPEDRAALVLTTFASRVSHWFVAASWSPTATDLLTTLWFDGHGMVEWRDVAAEARRRLRVNGMGEALDRVIGGGGVGRRSGVVPGNTS
jgi:hypothetical protein